MPYTWNHPTAAEIASAAASAVRGVWLIAGTPSSEPYPCRCHESKFGRCSPVFCPCAGRPDLLPESCCSTRFGPAEVATATAAWRMKKAARG